MSGTAVEVAGLGIRYRRKQRFFKVGGDEFWPLKDVTFTLERGESLGVIGRNGAGKSTLLQALAGIIRPDRGTITFHDVRVTLLALNVGFIPELTGRENAILSGRMLGMSHAEMTRLLPEIVAFAELEEFIDDPVGIYSSGMVVRLGFSVAIHVRTDVLLIDEVLGVGDLEFQAKSGAAIENIIRSNQTVVLVSHSPAPIETLCNRAVWIDGGVVRAEGEPAAVVEAYRSTLHLTPS